MHRPDEATLKIADQADQKAEEIALHETTLAVWDLQSPLIVSRQATVKVGAKCSAGCEITGRNIEICNDAGARIGSATLGSTPLAGTSALYWTEVQFIAPDAEGPCAWTVRFSEDDSTPQHREASSRFRFVTVKPPEHCVTVEVMAKDSETVLTDVEIRLGFYRGTTDGTGMAKVDVPKGSYELNVWKSGFEHLSRGIEVAGDVTLQLQLIAAPEPEDEYWKG